MKKSLWISLGLAVLVSACETDRQVREPWETKVNRHLRVETLSFKRGNAALSPQEKKKINNLIAQTKQKFPLYAQISLNVTQNKGFQEPYLSRTRNLKNYLEELGIEKHRVRTAFLAPTSAAKQGFLNQNRITLTLEQYEIVLPACKGWPEMGTIERPDGEQEFGCINEYNFANMVAEPRDLYESLPLAQRDGSTNELHLKKLREGKQEALRVEKIETAQ